MSLTRKECCPVYHTLSLLLLNQYAVVFNIILAPLVNIMTGFWGVEEVWPSERILFIVSSLKRQHASVKCIAMYSHYYTACNSYNQIMNQQQVKTSINQYMNERMTQTRNSQYNNVSQVHSGSQHSGLSQM